MTSSTQKTTPDRLVEICDEAGTDHIRVAQCNTGLGIFAVRPYPATAIIGEIKGEINDRPGGSEYSFDLENGQQLEPFEPFRYVNHCCDPNCEFDWIEEKDALGITRFQPFLVALRDIATDEQFTIDYNWPASCAIKCDCRSPLCRGWVVAGYDLGKLQARIEKEHESS